MDIIRRKIKSRRVSMKISQKAMAKMVGVSYTHYSNFERGRNSISDDMFWMVLDRLGLMVIVIGIEDVEK